jgi:dTDP-4-dehydrorhamnose reductase
MTPRTVMVVGAAGQLGRAMVRRLEGACRLVALTREDLDLTDDARVAAAVAEAGPDLIVNCSAWNAVDRAEDEPAGALAVNAFAVHALALAARARGAVLVHYSTDFVFDGTADRPYVETDRANPLSVYGQSKLIGEWLALEEPANFVLRVESLFGGPAARSSIDRILDAIEQDRPARVFSDRVVSPSYVEDVVDATLALVHGDKPAGLYHVANAGSTTWLGLAEELARIMGRPAALEPVLTTDVPMRAARPRYCALSIARLESAGVLMPPWQDALRRYVETRK